MTRCAAQFLGGGLGWTCPGLFGLLTSCWNHLRILALLPWPSRTGLGRARACFVLGSELSSTVIVNGTATARRGQHGGR